MTPDQLCKHCNHSREKHEDKNKPLACMYEIWFGHTCDCILFEPKLSQSQMGNMVGGVSEVPRQKGTTSSPKSPELDTSKHFVTSDTSSSQADKLKRIIEIIKIAHKLQWLQPDQKKHGYPLMYLSEVEKVMLAMVDDNELNRMRIWEKEI